MRLLGWWIFGLLLLSSSLNAWSQQRRKVIIDQDAAGPGGTDQQSILTVRVLGRHQPSHQWNFGPGRNRNVCPARNLHHPQRVG